jgi:hypothetical protein
MVSVSCIFVESIVCYDPAYHFVDPEFAYFQLKPGSSLAVVKSLRIPQQEFP